MDFVIPLGGGNSICVSKEGAVRSYGLKEKCPYCGDENCYGECDGYHSDDEGGVFKESSVDTHEREVTNTQIDTVEWLVLALCKAGYNITEDKFVEAVSTVIDTITNEAD
jgi:hypothetical protein